MLRMPVATLRVWERRYQLTQPETSPSGQRLYSAAEVQRLALIKRLSDLGHAIGSLARLDTAQLQEVAATHAQALSQTQEIRRPVLTPVLAAPAPELSVWRVAVIGAALADRLARPALLRRLGRPLRLLGPFESLADAQAGLAEQTVDLLLQQQARLHGIEALPQAAAGQAWRQHALLFRFAAEASCERLADAGVTLMREPLSDAALGQWLQSQLQALSPGANEAGPSSSCRDAAEPSVLSERRWDDAALADFASLSSTVACECPRHLAELLMQLSHFEAYSTECQHRSPSDAQLHAYLRQVAAQSRASFESALELVAMQEGLVLPQPRAEAAPKQTEPRRQPR